MTGDLFTRESRVRVATRAGQGATSAVVVGGDGFDPATETIDATVDTPPGHHACRSRRTSSPGSTATLEVLDAATGVRLEMPSTSTSPPTSSWTMTLTEHTYDRLDELANRYFPGRVVRKDLVRQVKVGASVPVYVLEFLLGKYCASDDPAAIEAGLDGRQPDAGRQLHPARRVREGQGRAQEEGQAPPHRQGRRPLRRERQEVLGDAAQLRLEVRQRPRGDRLQVRPPPRRRRLVRSSTSSTTTSRTRPRRRPSTSRRSSPSRSRRSTCDAYLEARREFSRDDWLDLVVRTIGLEPSEYDLRGKLLALTRLIPMAERNYNLIELGPWGTGKSFVYRESNPNAILISGGKVTVAQLFVNMSTGRVGLLGTWDVVAFDEVAGLQMSRLDGRQHAQGLHGVRLVRPRQGGDPGRGVDRVRRQHLEAPRGAGAHRPPLRRPAAGDDRPRVPRPAALLPARLGGAEARDSGSSPTTSASSPTTSPRRCASCASDSFVTRDRRRLRARLAPRGPRREGGPQDRVRAPEDPPPARRMEPRRPPRVPRVRHGGSPPGEGAAQEARRRTTTPRRRSPTSRTTPAARSGSRCPSSPRSSRPNPSSIEEAAEDEQRRSPPSLIAAGESKTVEYKQTARYNAAHRHGRQESRARRRQVASPGFLNAGGGVLLIGVHDKQEVTGLAGDYSTTGNKGRDGFENWLITQARPELGSPAVGNSRRCDVRGVR